jgi:hypothetical protein
LTSKPNFDSLFGFDTKFGTLPTTSESKNYSIHDASGYIKHSLQDMLPTDITAEELLKIAERLGVVNFLVPFRLMEKFMESNKNLWSLSCRREGNNSKSINIIFQLTL